MPLRLSTALLSAICAPCNGALYALRQRRPDPWRRTLGLGLRGEGTKFTLSALGVRWDYDHDDAECFQTLTFWLGCERLHKPRYGLSFRDALVEREPIVEVDFNLLDFGPDGTLRSLLPRNDAAKWGGEKMPAAVLAAHRQTLALPETERPRALDRAALAAATNPAEREAVRRLLLSQNVSFEPMPADRFAPPDFRQRRGLGGAGLDLVIRRQPAERTLDLWVQVQHTVDDGAPRQEILTTLERAYGLAPLAYPPDLGEHDLPIVPCSVEGERPLHLARDFVDLAQLQAWARERQAPVVAGLLWWLAREPEFAGRRFGVAVDVPASHGFERAVDLIGVRPADFSDFSEFAAGFLRLAAAARARRGPSWRAMRNASFLPAALAAEWMAEKQDLAEATFGTIGVTMLRDARVFVAPMADFGWKDGFLALGSTALPARGGGVVTSVTMKAESRERCRSLGAVRRAARAAR